MDVQVEAGEPERARRRCSMPPLIRRSRTPTRTDSCRSFPTPRTTFARCSPRSASLRSTICSTRSPRQLRDNALSGVPPGLSEMEVTRLMHERAEQDGRWLNFVGAGAYEHHIPAAVWQIATRGEFYSAYTPYQAEASQGTLQLLYEYQTMMTSLTGMDVTNASLYDGATAAGRSGADGGARAQGVRAACWCRQRCIRCTAGRAHDRQRTRTSRWSSVPYCTDGGTLIRRRCEQITATFAALVVPQPNYFGVLEHVDELTDWAHATRCAGDRRGQPGVARAVEAAGRMGRTTAPTSRSAKASRSACRCRGRSVLRLHGLQAGVRAADARPHRRPHAGRSKASPASR